VQRVKFVLGVLFAWLLLAPGTVEAQNCGGPGQRACCLLEASFGACRDGMTEVNGCSSAGIADCDCRDSNGNVGLFDSNSHCEQPSACGGPGQRACCIGESSIGQCQSGLVEIQGCNGDCLCGGDANPFSIQSSGTCVAVSPCGGKGQRACLVDERTGPACDEGLVEVPRCVGDCRGRAALTGSAYGISSGMCSTPETISEPGTNRTQPLPNAPLAPSSTCPLYGYMDMHLHLFSDLAHGGGVLAGKPYDEAGGVNAALQQCAGSNLPFVSQDLKTGAETPVLPPGLSCPTDFYPNGCGSRIFHGGHDIFNDSAGFGTRDGALEGLGGENSGLAAPLFNGWPRWTTTTHQQSYYKWLERAYQGGLRLTTMMAVTNEALCKGGKHVAGVNCENSMLPIEQQIAEAKKFETFIDKQAGPNGEDHDNGWFRIVLSPADARRAIAKGQMAVVLGVETAELFNCKFPIEQCTITNTIGGRTVSCPSTNGMAPTAPLTVPVDLDPEHPGGEQTICTADFVKNRVEYLHGLGVRHVFPIHNFDNGFGGSATWQDAIEVGNRVVEKHWWFPEGCPSDGGEYGFQLGDLTQFALSLIKFFFPGVITETPDRVLSTDPPSCNAYGLFSLGQTLVTELMNKGMLIDVDHMSRKAFDKTLQMAEARHYPGIMASHVISFDNYEQDRRHERMRTKAQLERIKGVGGMIAAMLKDDVLDGDQRGLKLQRDYANSTVKNDCRSSSKSFAQAYQYAVDVMGGPVGMGSDFNGTAGHFGPRFGSDACGGEFPFDATEAISNGTAQLEWFRERSAQYVASKQLEYPFTLPGFGTFDKQVTGQRTFDYNVDGMAHIGLLPDFVADLKTVGMADSDLNMLFRSAEAYIKVWEGARQVGLGEAPDASAPSCVSVTGNYPATVHDNELVILTASASPAGASITWDLGDGQTASGPIVFHSYASQGTKQVKVRAQDPLYGGVAEHTGQIVVETSNNTLFGAQIKINAPAQTYEGDPTPITFQHSDFQWQFSGAACGGGVAAQNLVVTPGVLQPTTGSMTCTYPGGLPPSVPISVTVFRHVPFAPDEFFTYSQPIQILNRPPSIIGAANASIAYGNPFNLGLTLSDVPGDKLRLTVDWGDGTPPLTSINLVPGPVNVPHTYAKPSKALNPYVVQISLSDEAATVHASLSVEVVGVPPVLTLQGPAQVSQGGVATYRFSGLDTDGGGTLLTLLSCGAGTLVRSDVLPVSPVQDGTVYTFDCRFSAASPATPVSVTYTDDEGQKTQKTLLVRVADTTPPVVSVPVPITREAASAQGVAVGFSASATDDVDGPLPVTCTPASDSVFARGTTTVECTAKDAAHNEGSASFTITVVDTTAPTILLAVSPQANAAGWHKDPVSILWTVTDLVGVTSASGCGPVSFASDTLGTVVTCTASDAAGNSSSKSVTVKLDRTAPTIVFGAASPSANANGWHRTDVSVGYTFSDAGSGLVPGAPAGGTLSFTTEGTGLTQSVSTADVAGNVASAASPAIHLDKTAPTIVGSRTPAANASGWNNTPVSVSFSCSDSLSGTEACSAPSTLGGEGANQSQDGLARDRAGNTASATVSGINIDLTPPVVTCSNTAPLLWPPNHGLVNIQTTIGVDGGRSGSAGFTLVSATSNEPDNGLGDGDTAGDIQGFVPGTPDTSGQLRAERSGKGSGRLYSLVYEGSDLAGNRTTCTTTVSVPKSQGGSVGAGK
jgi:microsomal dipeptidase-like Zn-dependent dipeptidase